MLNETRPRYLGSKTRKTVKFVPEFQVQDRLTPPDNRKPIYGFKIVYGVVLRTYSPNCSTEGGSNAFGQLFESHPFRIKF